MISVGVTGGIGSGKSVICNVWKKMGAFVVDSDKLAKELMTDDQELVKQIRNTFGKDAYRPDGTLDRSFLAKEAFSRNRVDELNKIVHPAVREKIIQLKETALTQGVSLFVQEAALLLDRGRPPGFDYIVLVTAPLKERIRWIQTRSGLSEEEILERMKSQKEDAWLMTFCDFHIVNNSTPEQLEKKSAELFHSITC